jgi:hypothetical protein
MLSIKINDIYRVEAIDRNNLVLLRLTEIKSKDAAPRMEYQNVGYYGRDLKKVIEALLKREVIESDVADFKKVVSIIEGHIASINYDSIVKGFMDQIEALENEVATLKRKNKNE